MKFIDERGRLFGIINIIDLSLLAIVALVAIFFLAAKVDLKKNMVTMQITVVAPNTRPEVVKNLKTNEPIIAGNEILNIKVKKISSKPAYLVTVKPDGTAVQVQDPYLKDVFITLEGKVKDSDNTVKIGTAEVRVGKKYTIRTLTYELETTVVSISKNKS